MVIVLIGLELFLTPMAFDLRDEVVVMGSGSGEIDGGYGHGFPVPPGD